VYIKGEIMGKVSEINNNRPNTTKIIISGMSQ
jgi:hypothetical protein